MEFKALFYIVAGVAYFAYSIYKKVQEKQAEDERKRKAAGTTEPASAKPVQPVSPPAYQPMQQIMRDLKKKQAEIEARTKQPVSKPKPLTTTKSFEKENLQREMKRAAEKETRAEEHLSAKIEQEEKQKQAEYEVYHHAEEVEYTPPVIDARQAFIGSIIFERKY